MEDSVSTIVYLVITFIILIASIIKKRKKNIPKTVGSDNFEPNQEEKPVTDAPKKGIEGFLNTLLEEQSPFAQELDSTPPPSDNILEETEFEEEWEEKKEEIEPETREGVSVFAKDDPETAKIETGLMNSLATKNMDNLSTVSEELEISELENLIDEFEIKKAIIYSEILYPKYF